MSRTMLVTLLAVCLLAGTAGAEGYRIFQEYGFGTPRDEIAAQPGVHDCSQVFGPGTLCKAGVGFLGHTWDMDFEFYRDRLISVSLITPYSEDVYRKTFSSLMEHFELVALQSTEETLDLVRLLHQNAKHFNEAVTRYETRGMANSAMAYVFFDKASISKSLTESGTARELLQNANEGLREVGFVLYKDQQNREWAVLSFDMPKLGSELLRQVVPENGQ